MRAASQFIPGCHKAIYSGNKGGITGGSCAHTRYCGAAGYLQQGLITGIPLHPLIMSFPPQCPIFLHLSQWGGGVGF
ncbi:hypothetical protein XENTR_v10020101 [Xenopus tropicalis]|nr:hypothetical protein XENTR_v10020101 [Xenopus tropicalis]